MSAATRTLADCRVEIATASTDLDSGPTPPTKKARKMPATLQPLIRNNDISTPKNDSFRAPRERPQHSEVTAASGDHSRTQLPTLDFREHGCIVYAWSYGEVEDLCASLLRSEVLATGWDLEWRTTFKLGEPPRKTALMQVCYQKANGGVNCLLLHIYFSGITPSLRSFLTNPVIIKAGVNATGDAHKVSRDFGITVEGVSEIMTSPVLAAELGARSRSLASLTERYMGCTLLKSRTQTSNWERKPLDCDQQVYAATDAYASLCIFKILQSMPLPAIPQAHPQPVDVTKMTQPAEGTVWVPAEAKLQRLQPAKAAVYNMLTEQGLSIADIAKLRNIQENTVAAYFAEAIVAGYKYLWPSHAIDAKVTLSTATFVRALLEEKGGNLENNDLASELQSVGVGIRELSDKLGSSLSFGQLRLLLAHLGRQKLVAHALCDNLSGLNM